MGIQHARRRPPTRLEFLLAAVLAVPVFKRFGLGAVLGYLAAGVLLGPQALAVVRDPERVLAGSEIGVVMLLFVIGLELCLLQDDEDALMQQAHDARRELAELFEADAGEGTLGRIVDRDG